MNMFVDSRWARPVLTGVLILFLLSVLLGAPQPVSARPAAEGEITRYVSTTGSDDSNDCATPGTPCLTINHAIGQSVNGDTIKVAVGTYTAASGTEVVLINKSITLSGGWDEAFEAQIDRSTIDGEGVRRGIRLDSPYTAIVEYFNVRRSYTSAIYNNSGTLTVNNSDISDNVRWGISNINNGFLILNNSVISKNAGVGLNNNGGTASLENSTISSNGGAGILSSGTINLKNITIFGNKGTGLDNNGGTASLENSTISSNGGAGIHSSSTINLNSITIFGNKGKGIDRVGGEFKLENTIVAGNTSGDCRGVITSQRHNLIGDTTGCTITADTGDQFNVDPKIGPLIESTGVHPLAETSPAVDAGNSDTCLPADQRGIVRPQGVGCDIGAYEYTAPGDPAVILVLSGDGQRAYPTSVFSQPLKVRVFDDQGVPVGAGVEVLFSAPIDGASGNFEGGDNSISVLTNEFGIVTTPLFTANNEFGEYIVNASVSGVVGSAEFSLLNGGWHVSPIGSDENDCASPSTPCQTINHAISQADAGEEIRVAVGTYTGSGSQVVLINKSITLSGGWDEAFEMQIDRSTIDGEGVRRGITINSGITTTTEYFTVQNGFNNSQGGGIRNNGMLTLNNSIINGNISEWMGGGIFNIGTLTINNTTISGNRTGKGGSGGGGGGGIQNYSGTVTINNSTVSGNMILGSYYGSGINNFSTLILNNSTISGNTGGDGVGVYNSGGTTTVNNGTITNNQTRGIINAGGNLSLQNTIIARNNGVSDCYNSGIMTSQGYNLIGNSTSCSFTPTTGDLVGTSISPIDPKLAPLQDNGGSTFTHALLSNSTALNAGNPSDPGSGENSCLPTDQRDVSRPEGDICDIGAYEGHVAAVSSITRLDTSPTGAANVKFKVIFTEAVTEVDVVEPFSDFAIAASGVESAAITAVSGSGDTYIVTVDTGIGNGSGTIRLDVVDDDSILDGLGNPLGGEGVGNGDFTSGESYSIVRVPTTILPKNIIIKTTPAFKWSKIGGVTEYQLQVFKGTKVVYDKIVSQSSCKAADCTHTSAKTLAFGNNYKWRVRAKLNGEWKEFSPFMAFKISAAKPGMWGSTGIKFYVTNTTPKVDRFAVDVYVEGCGLYRITRIKPVAIKGNKFSFGGAYYANGTFVTRTSVKGAVGFNNYPLPGCGYISGGPFEWGAKWKSTAQPKSAKSGVDIFPQNLFLPEGESPFNLFEVRGEE